jgi:hypothetical protein
MMTQAIPNNIKRILETALWTPSPDNLQPWRFKIINESSFEIHCKDESDWMVYDKNGHVTWLCIGFLFECIDIAAAEFAFKTQYEQQTSNHQQKTIFKVNLIADASIVQSPLFKLIPSRSVQRKPMSMKKLSAEEKQLLNSVIPEGFSIHWCESFSQKWAIGKLLFGNSYTRYAMKEGYDVHSKVIDWRKGYEEFSPTKIPPKSLGIDPLTVALTKWALAKWQRFHIIEKYFAGTVWARFLMDFQTSIRCSGHFLLTKETTATSLQDFIDSGRVVMRFWLTCQQLGLHFQPEHTPVMFSELIRNNTSFTDDLRANKNAKIMDDTFKKLFGRDLVKRSVYLARVGHAKAPTSRSMRKQLNELIIEE